MYVYKLKFQTAVHFGTDSPHGRLSEGNMTCHADTFFSGLCQEWLRIFGLEGLHELVSSVEQDAFFISDLFPFIKDELYVPRPVLNISKEVDFESIVDKKTMKKIKYIPLTGFHAYIEFLKRGGKLPFDIKPFGSETVIKRVNLRQEIPMPYTVSSYHFRDDVGLYFLLDTSEEIREKFEIAIESLGLTGLGGKKTSGMGKFELYEDSYELGLYDSDVILQELIETKGELNMALSVIAATVEDIDAIDLDNSFYTLIHRTGFIDSTSYSDQPLKKRGAMLFNSGSCFNIPISGNLLDVSNNGKHSVYRYGKGMFLGVRI